MSLRIPLPVKLMISYLVIVAIGAGPTYLYVRAKLQADLLADAASMLVAGGRQAARVIAGRPVAERGALLRLLGETTVDRITFLSPRGDVLYDSQLGGNSALENHGDRPEVSYALGHGAPRADFATAVRDAEGVGIARRISASNGVDTLYVALVTGPVDNIGILRLARPLDRISAMTSSMVRFVRNAQAVAVSLAIGFSLLAAILFVRPLQRVGSLVNALASGDLGAQAGRLGNDEVGDVGRALDQMALSLRQRLLAAGIGEALLTQLVEALPTPCVVFEESGEVLTLNGAARRGLCIEGAQAGKRMKELAEHPQVQRALQAAEDEGEPEPIELPLDERGTARGCMHVLKRPGMAPLRVFIGSELPRPETSLLPLPEEVEPRSLEVLLAQVQVAVTAELAQAQVGLELSPQVPQILVADARHRLEDALCAALRSAAGSLSGGQGTLHLESAAETTRVRLQLDAAISAPVAAHVQSLLTPLGGAVEVGAGETRLWLPRA
jgi:HAMP domain-containing protein